MSNTKEKAMGTIITILTLLSLYFVWKAIHIDLPEEE